MASMKNYLNMDYVTAIGNNPLHSSSCPPCFYVNNFPRKMIKKEHDIVKDVYRPLLFRISIYLLGVRYCKEIRDLVASTATISSL